MHGIRVASAHATECDTEARRAPVMAPHEESIMAVFRIVAAVISIGIFAQEAMADGFAYVECREAGYSHASCDGQGEGYLPCRQAGYSHDSCSGQGPGYVTCRQAGYSHDSCDG